MSAPEREIAARRRRIPPRLLSVLLAVAGGGAGLLASTQPWFSVTLYESPDAPLSVAGAAALPVLAPLSLAALALGAALSIAARVLAYVVGVLTLLIGGTMLVLTAPIAFGTPLSAVASTVTEATGIAGEAAVGDLVDAISTSGWAVVGMLGGLLVTAAGVLILVTAHRWRLSGRRYRTDADTPTRGAESAGADASATPDRQVDAFDAWDGLSRGDDPTR